MLKARKLKESGSTSRLPSANSKAQLNYSSGLTQRLRLPYVHRVTLKLVSGKQSRKSSSHFSSTNQQLGERYGSKTPRLFDSVASHATHNISTETTTKKSINIKTYVRFRPYTSTQLLQSELGDRQSLYLQHNSQSVIINEGTFNFDRVFGPQDNQQKIFQQTARPLIDKVLQGYNATLFAYGQTGSGKTYTMFGSESNQGMVPLSVANIFHRIENQPSSTRISCSLLQIYRENLIDLIEPDNGKQLKIKETQDGTTVSNLTEKTVVNEQQVLELINRANDIKRMRQTAMNESSSRSHVLFILHVERKSQGKIIKARLNLVDLAGSEKVSKSKAQGESLEEAKKINLSLSCLGNTINALTKNHQHVPFRQSKLTRLLRESLTGNYLTALIVTCSSHSSCVQQSLSSLKFASRIKHVKTQAVQNIEETQQRKIQKRLYETLKEEYGGYEQKLDKVKDVVNRAIKVTNGEGSPWLSEIQDIIGSADKSPKELNTYRQNPPLTAAFDGSTSPNMDSLRSRSGHIEPANNRLFSLEAQLVTHQKRIKQLQEQLQQKTQRIKQLQSDIGAISHFKQNLQQQQLISLILRQIQWIRKNKESYDKLQKQILQQQVNSLIDRICRNQSLDCDLIKLRELNKNQQKYIQILEENIVGYSRMLQKCYENPKLKIQASPNRTLMSCNNLETSPRRQLLPLTYAKAIEQLKKKNERIREMEMHQHTPADWLNMQQNVKRLQRRVEMLQEELRMKEDRTKWTSQSQQSYLIMQPQTLA